MNYCKMDNWILNFKLIFVSCSLGYDCSERTCPYGDNPVSFIFSVWHSLQSWSFFFSFSLTFLSLVLSSLSFYFFFLVNAFHLSRLAFKLLKNAILLHYFCLFSFPSYRARCDFHANYFYSFFFRVRYISTTNLK